MASAAKYAQDDHDGDAPSRNNAEVGRACVRRIQQYPVLSVEWLAMLEELKKLSRLVLLEARMLPNAKVTECAGRDTESCGTLWDQEAQETAIRILVEEAKVNLCLRIMADFKIWSFSPEKERKMAEATQVYEYQHRQLEQKLAQFEEYMGLLLRQALHHVETLQLMDIPLLIEHITSVLRNWANRQIREPEGDIAPPLRSQETDVLYYFSALMKHAEALNNEQLLAKANELQLVNLVVEHVLKYDSQYSLEILEVVVVGFAYLAENEDFRSAWQSFFPSKAEMLRFLDMEKSTNRILQECPEKKSKLRPVLDFFRAIERYNK